MKTPIKDLIIQRLEEDWNAPLPYTPKPNMKLSFLGTPCLRKIYYSFLRVPPDSGWKYQQIKTFQKGEAFHEMAKKWLRDLGFLIDYRNKGNGQIPKHWKTGEPDPEFPVNDLDLNIKNNKIDGVGILEGIPGIKDGLWVWEIKSINEKGFTRYIEKGPKTDNLQQAMSYAFLLEEGLRNGAYKHMHELDGYTEVQGVIMLYLNRENDKNDWKEFVVPKDAKIFTEVVEKIIKTKQYIAEGKLPGKTPDFCDWCQFRESCDRDFKVK